MYLVFFLSFSTSGDAAVHVLESGPLGIEGQACLEFWYLVPVAANGSELRVLLKSSTGSVEIWTSPALPQDAWREASVLLNTTEQETRVKWNKAPQIRTVLSKYSAVCP